MKLYRLNRTPSEDAPEGEDWDEWFTSYQAALRRRRELIQEDPRLVGHRTGSDFSIDRVELARLSPGKLALAILNRRGYIRDQIEVKPAYLPGEEGRA